MPRCSVIPSPGITKVGAKHSAAKAMLMKRRGAERAIVAVPRFEDRTIVFLSSHTVQIPNDETNAFALNQNSRFAYWPLSLSAPAAIAPATHKSHPVRNAENNRKA
jgi:hypothetical protein